MSQAINQVNNADNAQWLVWVITPLHGKVVTIIASVGVFSMKEINITVATTASMSE